MAEKSFGVKEINLIGASGTPTIESPNNLNLNAVNVAISTNATIGGNLTVTGNIGIAGTLTYEDVTNIDAIGIITARSDIKVGTAVTITSAGAGFYAGIITASNFVKRDGTTLGGGVTVQDEGSSLSTTATTLNFVGSGVVASGTGATKTITISGGGSGAVSSDAQGNTVGGTQSGDAFSGTSALRNTLYGYDSGTRITTGDDNTHIGYNAGSHITSNFETTFIGSRSGADATGARNTGIGMNTLKKATSSGNTAVGYNAAENMTSGDSNVCVGGFAGDGIVGGADNVILGYNSDVGASSNNNIVIGYDISAGSISNQIVLGNSNITKFSIPGINFILKDNGGTPTQGHVLTVDANGEASFAAASGGGGGGGITGISTTGTSFFNELEVSGTSTFSDRVTITKSSSALKVNVTTTNSAIDIQRGGSTKAKLTPEYGEFRVQTNGSEDLALQVNSSGGSSGDIHLKSLSDKIVTVKGTGNVGIKSDTPTSQLDVIGDVKVVGVITATSFHGDGSNLTGISGGGGSFTTDSQFNLVAGEDAGSNFSGTSAEKNILLGHDAGRRITTGDNNIAIGDEALAASDGGNITGSGNIAIGRQAMNQKAVTGSGNVIIGDNRAGRLITSGSHNIGMGQYSLHYMATGTGNIAIGYACLDYAEGTGNVAIGHNSGTEVHGTGSSGSYNTLYGYGAGSSLSSGSNCIIIGKNAQASSNSVSDEITLGNTDVNHLRIPGIGVSFSEGGAVFSGIVTATNFAKADGTGLGGLTAESGGSANTHSNNAAGSLTSNSTGNVILGWNAGNTISTGDNNTVIGYRAGGVHNNSQETMIGANCFSEKSGHTKAVGLGFGAGKWNQGDRNTAIGYESVGANGNSSGDNNTGVGYAALRGITDGSNNVALGYAANNQHTTGSNCIVIGANANASAVDVSNEITLGDSNITKFRVPGINFILKDNGGTPTEGHVLTVDGSGEASFVGIAITEAPVTDYTISANGSSAYRIHGGGVDETANNPDLYLIRGQKYRFNNTTGSSHPFAIRVSNGGSAYTDGISGSNQGIQFFTVPYDAPASLVYQCTIHSGMVGNIYIHGGSSTANISNNADNRVITGGSGGNLNGESNLTFDGNNLAMSGSGVFTLTRNSRTLTLEGNYGNEGHPAIKTSSGHDLRIMTNGNNEKVRITSGGTINIGGDYTNTTGKLKVTGTTTIDGNLSVSQKIVHTGDTDTLIEFATNAISFDTAGDERLRIDTSGRVLIGHDVASGDLHGPQHTTNRNPYFQLHGSNALSSGAALISWKNSAGAYYAPVLYLAHSGSDTKGTNGILPTNGEFGSIVFSGDDGTDFVKGAMIKARLDGTPGNNDMPGRLEFYTTPDGAQVPEERLRIHSDGKVSLGTPSSTTAKFNISHGNEFGLYTSGPYNFQAKFESTDSEAAIVIEDSNSTNDGNRIGVITNDMTFITDNDERLRIDGNGNMQLGSANDAGNDLRYLDVYNLNTGADAGSIIRFITRKSDGSSSTSADIVKYKSGGLHIKNNEVLGTTGFIAFSTGTGGGSVTEKLRIAADGTITTLGTTARSDWITTTLKPSFQIASNYNPWLSLFKHSADQYGPYLLLGKTRGSSDTSNTVVQNNDELGNIMFEGTDGSTFRPGARIVANIDGTPGSGDMPTRLSFHTTKDGEGNVSEKMRITNSGDVLIGKTSSNFDTAGTHIDADGQIFKLVKSGTGAGPLVLNRSTNVGTFIEFRRGSGNIVGSISSNNTNTSYNTSSDYRLKENVTAISDGITRLKTLKPSRFNFIADATTTVDGFLAHEVTAVPEAITGTKDEVDSDNKPVYQGIDQSKLVPLLTAALQEAITKIETLEAEVSALKGS